MQVCERVRYRCTKKHSIPHCDACRRSRVRRPPRGNWQAAAAVVTGDAKVALANAFQALQTRDVGALGDAPAVVAAAAEAR